MPNWCSNTLEVRGNVEQLKEFTEKSFIAETGEFTMGGLLPTPKELTEVTSPVMWRGDETDLEGKATFEAEAKRIEETYGHADWYSWNTTNWGTKWDVAESTIGFMDDDALIVSYDTAWSPNINWVEQVSKMFPDLEFRLSFMEPGCNFCGVAHCVDGEVEVSEGDIEWTDEDGNPVATNDDCRWYRTDTNEIIEDEDFYPFENNPFDY